MVDNSGTLTKDEIMSLLLKAGTGYKPRNPSEKIFLQANRRLGVVSEPRDDPDTDSGDNAIFCNAPFCPQQFSTVSEFESHYNLLHRFFCSQCKKYLPTAHLLDLHLEENHDSFFELLAKKKESFRCFVEECQERFWTQSERRDHGIRTHKLPSNFRFATKEKKPEPPVTVDEKMEDDQEKITEKPRVAKVIAKSSVIKPITFGHNAPRSFYTSGGSSYAKALTKTEKKSKDSPADPLDNKMVVDLLESLPEVN